MMLVGLLSMAASCAGYPAPSFERATNLSSVPYIEVPIPGEFNVTVHIEGCPRSYQMLSCGTECGVLTNSWYVDFQYRSHQNTLRIKTSDYISMLEQAESIGCFSFGRNTNVAYERIEHFRPSGGRVNIVTVTETFVR